MHAVFRIDEIIKIDNIRQLWQVELRLTSDSDQQLQALTKRIREEIMSSSEWLRLAALLTTIGQLNKAKEVCQVLLNQTSNESMKAIYYRQLGCIKTSQGDYERALSFHETAHNIFQKMSPPPPNHRLLSSSYNSIALVYHHLQEYPKALLYYKKGLEINEKFLSSNHRELGTSYNNIAGV
jgi:tetratricopeptide (TPR) repeat protein